jgi:hypothetical protein
MNTGVQNSAPLMVDAQSINIIQAKILYTLSIYPRLSASMLQTGIGPAIPPAIWRPVLEGMIAKNWIQETQINRRDPGGRANSPKILSLTALGLTMVPNDDGPDIEGENISDESATVASQVHSQGRP